MLLAFDSSNTAPSAAGASTWSEDRVLAASLLSDEIFLAVVVVVIGIVAAACLLEEMKVRGRRIFEKQQSCNV